MTERPILFSGPMVRAILDGRKTVTRRVLKPRGRLSLFDDSWSDDYVLDPGNAEWREAAYPWRVGDRLWVREAWRSAAPLDDISPSAIGEESMEIAPVRYEADGEAINWLEWRGHDAGRLRAGMHMPRWASRITLEVTGVKVERLQDISASDAVAEGALSTAAVDQFAEVHAIPMFRAIWLGINGPGSWEANPWVVAISFKRVTP